MAGFEGTPLTDRDTCRIRAKMMRYCNGYGESIGVIMWWHLSWHCPIPRPLAPKPFCSTLGALILWRPCPASDSHVLCNESFGSQMTLCCEPSPNITVSAGRVDSLATWKTSHRDKWDEVWQCTQLWTTLYVRNIQQEILIHNYRPQFCGFLSSTKLPKLQAAVTKGYLLSTNFKLTDCSNDNRS